MSTLERAIEIATEAHPELFPTSVFLIALNILFLN